MSLLTLTFEELEFMTQTCFKSLFETEYPDIQNVQKTKDVPRVPSTRALRSSFSSAFSSFSSVQSLSTPPEELLSNSNEQEDFFLIDIKP